MGRQEDKGAEKPSARDSSRSLQSREWLTIAGFSCLEATLFGFLYIEPSQMSITNFPNFYQGRPFFAIAFLLLALGIVRLFSPKARDALFSRTLLWCYSLLLALGTVLAALPGSAFAADMFESLLVGLPMGWCLAAWGRQLSTADDGRLPILVMAAGALAGLVLLPLSFLSRGALALLGLLPLISCALLCKLQGKRQDASSVGAAETPQNSPLRFSDVVESKADRAEASLLSLKMISGSLVFGLSAGFMQVFRTDVSHEASAPASFLLLALLAFASLQLLGGFKGASEEQTGQTLDAPNAKCPVDEVYRLVLLLMMAGFLFVPVLGSFAVPGESIVLAGYLGLTFVLVTLYLLMAKARSSDPALAFARGFSSLFIGVLCGIALGNVMVAFQPEGQIPFAVTALAGLATLFSYLFLFTEADFDALSVIVRTRDSFAELCETITARYKLSKRESEILPLALRGRTGERIANELFIAKSTAETHLRRIYSKTGTHGRQELIDLSEDIRRQLAQGTLPQGKAKSKGAKGKTSV